MKLPHLAPLIFAQEILFLDEKKAKIRCKFDTQPSLAMFIEASAQSSAAFFQEGGYTVGYLVNAKNIQWINKSEDTQFIITLDLEISFESMSNYSFIATDLTEQKTICSGEFTISIQ